MPIATTGLIVISNFRNKTACSITRQKACKPFLMGLRGQGYIVVKQLFCIFLISKSFPIYYLTNTLSRNKTRAGLAFPMI